MKIGQVFYLDENYSKIAAWCNENCCFIEEIEKDDKGRRFVVKQAEKIDVEQIIRSQREYECFSIINRGVLWYDSLSAAELEELKSWYQHWLDAPATKKVPQKPKWLI